MGLGKGWIAVFVLAGCAAATVFVMGRRLPVAHVASISGVVQAPQERGWELVSDTPQQANWRTGVRYITSLPPQQGRYCWEEARGAISIPFCPEEEMAPGRRVVRVALTRKGKKPSFSGGTWTWELAQDGPSSTRVTITERVTITSPLWRFLGHYVRGDDSSVKQYLADLRVESTRQR